MSVKLLAQTILLFITLLEELQGQQNALSWPSLANHVRKELHQQYIDSLTYYRPKCDSIRNEMHEVALSTGLDNSFMFGPQLEFLREGLSKEFQQKPQVPTYYKPGQVNKMAQVVISHVHLFDLDVHLSHWLDAKMILDGWSKQDLAKILESNFHEVYEDEKQLGSVEAQRTWALKSIQEHIAYVLRNSPYFWAFKRDGHLRNDTYHEDLQQYKTQARPPKPQTQAWIQQFNWLVPPVLDKLQDAALSAVNGDTLIMVYNGEQRGVVNKQGKIIVPFNYERVGFPYPAWIEASKNRESDWYNRKGELVLQGYEAAYPHAKGYAVVQKAEKWGAVDADGKTLVPLNYERYRGYQGKQIFYQGKDSLIYEGPNQTATPPFVMDRKTVAPIPPKVLAKKFSRAQTFDVAKGWYAVQKDGLEGLVDSLGQEVLPLGYDRIIRKSSNLISLQKDRKAGYWIISKNIRVEPKYKSLQHVEDSSMMAIVGNGKEYGLLDLEKDGLLFPFSEYSIEYRKPYFLLKMKYDTTGDTYTNMNGYLHGLLGAKGQMIEKPDSVDILTYFNESYFITPHRQEKSTPYAVLKSAKGKVLRQFKDLQVITSGAWIRHYGKDYQVKWVSYRNYRAADAVEEISNLTEELYMVKREGLWGFASRRGEMVFPIGFTAVKASKNGLIVAKVNDKWGILKNPKYKPK